MACDVGGTDIKAALVLPSDEIVGLRRIATPRSPDNPGQAIVDRLAQLAEDYRRHHPEHPLTAIGLVVPGLVDEAAGIGIHSSNLGWNMFPFVASAESSIGVPVAFGHDVGAAGEAEFRLGAAASSQDAAIIVIGTGVAVSLFCDGRRIIGNGYAGELGHVPIPDPDAPCSWTILEKVGSAASIASRYTTATGRAVEGAREVLAMADGGDAAAQRVWAEAVEALSSGVAQMVSLLGTETVVIGGGLSQAGEALLAPLREAVDERLTFHRRPRIVQAVLGENAGIIGAAAKARKLASNHSKELK